MVDSTQVFTSQPYPKKKNNLSAVIGTVIVVAIVVGGIIYFRQSKKTVSPKIAVVNQEPSPTVTPAIDKNTVKIQVQNGTGTPGQAGTAVDALKTAGYNSDNIKTANAPEFTNTVTAITARAGFENVANDIKTSLSGVFTDINIDSSKLDTSSAFDIVIVTGGKKFELTPTTAPAATQTPIPVTTTVTPTTTLTPTPTVTPTL